MKALWGIMRDAWTKRAREQAAFLAKMDQHITIFDGFAKQMEETRIAMSPERLQLIATSRIDIRPGEKELPFPKAEKGHATLPPLPVSSAQVNRLPAETGLEGIGGEGSSMDRKLLH